MTSPSLEPTGFSRVVVIDTPGGAIRGRPAEFRQRGLSLFPAMTATDALKMLGGHPSSVVVAHTRLRDMRLLDFVQIVTTMAPAPVFIGIDSNADMDLAAQSLDNGARGLISLPMTPSNLADAVHTVPVPLADGPTRYECVGLVIDTAAHRATWLDKPVRLAPREFEVLAHLMSQHPRFVSIEEVASQMGTPRSGSAHDRVRHMMSRLRARLAEANPGVEVPIETVHRVGYRLTPFPNSSAPSPQLALAHG